MMIDAVSVLLLLPATTVVALVGVPGKGANSQMWELRQILILIAGIHFISASCFLFAYASYGTHAIHSLLFSIPSQFPVSMTALFGGVASWLFTLVCFMSWVICRYSIWFLDGKATQGRYVRWIAFTVGTVSLMVVSANLLMFVATWLLTSSGLHQPLGDTKLALVNPPWSLCAAW
jgi:NAD(P)H-quinone oxidoreductase subunit 5